MFPLIIAGSGKFEDIVCTMIIVSNFHLFIKTGRLLKCNVKHSFQDKTISTTQRVAIINYHSSDEIKQPPYSYSFN